jgi:hypothetical protein
MAIFSFKPDQLFMLLVPGRVVGVCDLFNRPHEPDFVKNYLSILSNCVIAMIFPLITNPPPKRLVFFVPVWHHAMAIDSFKLDKLFILHVPELIMFRHGFQ